MLGSSALAADPLEQFSIYINSGFGFISNLAVFLFIIFFIFQFDYSFGSNTFLYNYQLIKLGIFNFVKGIVQENLSINQHIYFPILFVYFLFILFCNFMGMIPYSLTITSSFVVTLFLSLSFFIGINIIGWLVNRIKL